MQKNIILLAGGTGLIGKEIASYLSTKGAEIRILTRNPKGTNQFYWNPAKQEIDESVFLGVTHIINLSGVGIAEKRWTKKRKQEIIDSRVEPTKFLAQQIDKIPNLKQYISASGINCYGYNDSKKTYFEHDDFGKDYLSNVVEKWEKSADMFQHYYKVVKIRISVVLTEKGGALAKIAKPISFGFGAGLGSGKQAFPWIHLLDLVRIFEFVIDKNLEGSFNSVAGNPSNKEFTLQLAKKLNKKIRLPNVPIFILKILLGEMSSMLLNGIKASNEKLKKEGFEFQYEDLEDALNEIYSKNLS
jgi:uncharacterized protein